MVTHQLNVERATGKVHQPKTDVLATVPRNQPKIDEAFNAADTNAVSTCVVMLWLSLGCGEQLTKTMLARECAECVKCQQDTTSALLDCFKHKFLGNSCFSSLFCTN